VEASYLLVFDKSNSNVKEDYQSKMGTNINQNGNDHLKEVQMKTSMMKLGVFVMVAAMVMFTLVAPASADGQKYRQTLDGEYAVVGSAQCAFSPQIDPVTLLPAGPGLGSSLSPSPVNFYNGTYKFSHNGWGSASLTGKGFNNGPPPDSLLGGWVQLLEFDFNYTVEDGEITFTTIPGTDTSETIAGQGPPPLYLSSGPQKGNISPDGKTLLIHCGAPVIINIGGLPFPVEAICNMSLNGFRQGPYRPSR
jgi:hypothetical protein